MKTNKENTKGAEKAILYLSSAKTPKELKLLGSSYVCHKNGGILKTIQMLRIANPNITAKQVYDWKKYLQKAVEKYPFTEGSKYKMQ